MVIGRKSRSSSISCRSEEHTSELQSHSEIVCRLLLEKKKTTALPGILPGIQLTLERIAGDTAPLLFTALNNRFFSTDVRQPISTLTVQVFFFNDTATPEIYTLSLHDALPISFGGRFPAMGASVNLGLEPPLAREGERADRKSTRLNSSHTVISYAVFCLKKKKKEKKDFITKKNKNNKKNKKNK